MLQPGQTYTFPFSFRFPAASGNNRHNLYENDGDERWTIQPHILPPSFLINYSFGSDTEPNFAKIEYGVKAKLICPGVGVVHGKMMADLISSAPILFQPLNPHLQEMMTGPLSVIRHPKTFSYSSSALTGQDPKQISFRQNLRDRFSSSTPKLDFEAALEIPDLLASGAEFCFRASFTAMAKSDGVTRIPPVVFKVLKLELLDFTFARASRDWDAANRRDGHRRHPIPEHGNMPPPDQPYRGPERTPYEERKTTLNSIPESATVELEPAPPSYSEKGEKSGSGVEKSSSGEASRTEQAQSCQVWFTSRVPGFTPPTFKSFAISRAYRVKVKLGVEVGGKQFVLEAESFVRDLVST